MIIKNGNIFDAVNDETYVADIKVENGKIVEIGKDLCGDEVFDATGLNVYPGLVEAHCHIGLDGYAVGFERQDYNEIGNVISSELRAIDGINPFDETFKKAREAGVTSVCTGPGSADAIGGSFVAIKTVGTRVDNMIIKYPVAMKCALGENPKRCYRDKGNCNRMTTASNIRNTMYKAKEYLAKKEAAKGDVFQTPPFDIKLEALIPVLKKEIPLKIHAHAADDIFTAIRLAKEFDVKMTLEHVTDGHLIAEELVKEGYPMAVGPTFSHATKVELMNKSWKTPAVLSELGGLVSIVTDSPVVPQEYLPLFAGIAVREGMDKSAALKAITINPAKHIGIQDRVGSLEVGKDADIVITDGDLLSVEHKVVCVLIDGKKVN